MRRRARTGIIPLIPLIPLFTACGGGANAATYSKPTKRDSAGVTIVQNTTPVWHDGSGWTLSQKPAVAIGVLDGAPEYQFYQIRGTVRLEDGTIVVANASSSQLRFFDPSGKFVKSVGRQGAGPGEFKQLGRLYLFPGDTIGAFDYSLQRMSLFTSDGQYVRSYALRAPGGNGFLAPVAAFSDGALLMLSYAFSMNRPQSGVQRDSNTYVWSADQGATIDTVGRFVGSQFLVVVGDNFMSMNQVAFGRGSFMAVHDTSLVFGTNDAYQFEWLDRAGHVKQIVRDAHQPVAVSSHDVSAYRDSDVAAASTDNEKKLERTMMDKMPWPETLPAYANLMVDAAGNVWVQGATAPRDSTNQWTVFGPDGWKLGRVSLPFGYKPDQIGTDYMLGVWKDVNDVEHVLEFGIEKPEVRTKEGQ